MEESKERIFQLIAEVAQARTVAERLHLSKELHTHFTFMVGEVNHLQTELDLWQNPGY